MKRKIYGALLEWKEKNNGRTALLVEGARGVGKTFTVREFAEKEYKSYIIIDFSENDERIIKIFENDVSNIQLLLQKLSFLCQTKLYERKSLIVFDNVQFCPKARQAIKHLVADGRYDYIETGLLISFEENTKDILIPSEETGIQMFPMDFEEFCWAVGDTITVPYIRSYFAEKEPMGEGIHDITMRRFCTYMLVGGMPQAVSAYAENRKFSDAEDAKRKILSQYAEEIHGKSRKISSVYDNIPSQLNKHDKRFNLSSVSNNGRMSSFGKTISWLSESMIVNFSWNSVNPDRTLYADYDRRTMKCYMGDTGLLITAAIDSGEVKENEVYLSLLDGNLHINEGMFAENVTAQILRCNNHKLFFHSFYDREQNNNKYEVDFLIRDRKKICPIEVKSSIASKHASLDRYMKKYSKTLGQAYVLCTGDLRKEGNILYLPIYMAICL